VGTVMCHSKPPRHLGNTARKDMKKQLPSQNEAPVPEGHLNLGGRGGQTWVGGTGERDKGGGAS
jgi:hypothetical protein